MWQPQSGCDCASTSHGPRAFGGGNGGTAELRNPPWRRGWGPCAYIVWRPITPLCRGHTRQVRASPPAESGALDVSCPARRAVAIRIPVANPTGKPLVLRAAYSSPALVGPGKVTIPPANGSRAASASASFASRGSSAASTGGNAGMSDSVGTSGGSGGVFECYYAPLAEGEDEGMIRLVGEEAGEWA